MKNSIIGTNAKSRNIACVISLLTAALFFLPWVKADSKVYSGFSLLKAAFDGFSSNNRFVVILLIAVPLALCVICGLIFLLARKKALLYPAVIGSAITALAAVLFLFNIKKVMDQSGLSESFLIRDLRAGYWLFLAAALIALVAAMGSVKLSSGYILLVVMSVIWLFPIIWIILTSFRAEQGFYSPTFFPESYTLDNYKNLLTDTGTFHYARWYANTLLVAVCSCMLSTFIILSTAYTLSRIRFLGRKGLMNILLILGMFPGFMAMIAVYYIIKGIGLNQSLGALILVYGGGSALGYYVVKGFFDTIPRALDEAACIDGATKWQIFTKITMPLSKPIIIYTVLTSFISPWADYIFANVILGDNYENYTVALGLFKMLENSYIETWYTRFAAGAVLVSIPIAALFISLQKYYVEGMAGSVKG